MDIKEVPAGEFKQRCLAILDDVEGGGLEVVITKRGRAVARLVPVARPEEREAAVLSRLRGHGRSLVSEAELLRPTLEDAGWDLAPRP